MSRLVARSCLLSVCLLAGLAAAAERPRLLADRAPSLQVGGPNAMARTETDTVYLLGGPDRLDGRFEDSVGIPHWQGWTHVDQTENLVDYWHVSDFQALAGAYSMWCGTVFPDGDPGYGNQWYQNLVFSHAVAENNTAHTVGWTALLRVDTEPDYDYVYVQVNRGGEWQTLQVFDGVTTPNINETIDLNPGDFVGPDANEIQLRVRVVSDHIWSDEDGNWDTDGACQYDDAEISVDGVVVDFEDFEDQVSDRWLPEDDPGVGDFAAIWSNLYDLDPCISNYSPQVGFIDDGYVVPGTGGTQCITWCYGPGGYILNNSGGLAGPDHHLDNVVVSPVLEWPSGGSAAYLQFLAYDHEELANNTAGMFYQWHVRSVASGDPDDLETAPWRGYNFVYYGGPNYVLRHESLTGLLVTGLTHLQVALRVVELGYQWTEAWDGDDGTPAPYFDNVQVVAYTVAGPSVTARTVDLLNDGFPASGELDLANLAANSVRLDMAANVSPPEHLRNDPGDSVVFQAATIRAGATLLEPPRVYVRMRANPVFRGVRALPANFTLIEDGLRWHDLVSGWVETDSVFFNGGTVENRWSFDLPDTGFFYPGDVIHYYVEAQDNASGDIGTSRLPADTTGYAAFAVPDEYDSRFTVRALPTVLSTGEGDQPQVLLWDDHGDADALADWRLMLAQNWHREGRHYDLFVTNSPSSAVGNGLGGRATVAQLEFYDIILYTSGDRTSFLIGNGDFAIDPSDDVGLLADWLDLGERHLLLTGDNVASDLWNSGAATQQFLAERVGVAYHAQDVRPLIGGQTAPLVLADSFLIFVRADRWIAYGGCPLINRFDAVSNQGSATRQAEFTDYAGNPGHYFYAAASHHLPEPSGSDVVLLPCDLTFAYTAPGWVPPQEHAGHPVRTVMLYDILSFFGWYVGPWPGVAPDAVLQVRQYPNPFNPRTTIALDLPRASDVSLKIYDLRGALVRVLVDERLAAGHHEIAWDGTDRRGAAVASGVYFCETRAGGEVRVHKLALVK